MIPLFSSPDAKTPDRSPKGIAMNSSAICGTLKADPKVQALLDGFQTATGIQLTLSPVVPPSLGDLMSGARERRFCKCLPDASDETRANCLRTHTELRTTASANGALESRVCLAGLTHATTPIVVDGHSVAVLEITGLAIQGAVPVELTENFRRFLQTERLVGNDEGIGKILNAFETLERHSEREIGAIYALVEVLSEWIGTHASLYPDVAARAVPTPLARAKDFAKNRYSDAGLTSIQVAAEVGITSQRLAQLFREFMGMTFGEWIARHRVSIAMAKLRGSHSSILDIAEESGFGTVSSFYRAFEKFAGVSPNRYRQGEDPANRDPLL